MSHVFLILTLCIWLVGFILAGIYYTVISACQCYRGVPDVTYIRRASDTAWPILSFGDQL
jgi:hypothetical protein